MVIAAENTQETTVRREPSERDSCSEDAEERPPPDQSLDNPQDSGNGRFSLEKLIRSEQIKKQYWTPRKESPILEALLTDIIETEQIKEKSQRHKQYLRVINEIGASAIYDYSRSHLGIPSRKAPDHRYKGSPISARRDPRYLEDLPSKVNLLILRAYFLFELGKYDEAKRTMDLSHIKEERLARNGYPTQDQRLFGNTYRDIHKPIARGKLTRMFKIPELLMAGLNHENPTIRAATRAIDRKLPSVNRGILSWRFERLKDQAIIYLGNRVEELKEAGR